MDLEHFTWGISGESPQKTINNLLKSRNDILKVFVKKNGTEFCKPLKGSWRIFDKPTTRTFKIKTTRKPRKNRNKISELISNFRSFVKSRRIPLKIQLPFLRSSKTSQHLRRIFENGVTNNPRRASMNVLIKQRMAEYTIDVKDLINGKLMNWFWYDRQRWP